MATSRRNITKATAVIPAALKGKGKTIEVPDRTDRQPNLSDVHISNARDSHLNIVPSCGTQAAEPELRPDSEQLL